ncbi:methyl-accepting chemotaxis protein [Selenomonas artemidis]|uniref:methyl-accepting chemotaxis protein n=1 Tax=Selenomonas artemidis TaxID=671224 RepID=UPI0028ED4F37|nr:methyl-accepting chemotaxis protein [Selenomonas artemidis]
MQFKSIRTKFLALVLPIVLIGFLVFFGVSYKTASDMLDTNAETIGVGIGKQAGLEVRRVFESNKAHLEEMSYDDAFLHGDDAAKIAKMQEVKQNTQVFSVVSYLDVTGKGFSVEGEQIERSGRDYFKKVMQTQQTVISEPLISGSTGKVATVIAVPVKANGTVIGVVTGTVKLSNFNDDLKNLFVHRTGHMMIADESGIVIIDPTDESQVGKLDLSKDIPNKPNGAPLVAGFKDVLDKNDSTVVHYVDGNGEDLTAMLVPVQLDGRRWVVIGEVATREVREEANSLLGILAGLTLVMLLLVSGIIFLMTNSFAVNIKKVVRACDLLNDGDLRDKPKTITSEDELGQLSDGFIKMRRTLHDLISNVQSHALELSKSAEAVSHASQQSADASTQVADTITEIAAGAEKQHESAVSVTNAATAISEHTATMSERAEEVAAVTNNTIERVREGRHSIDKVVSYMQQIKTGSETVDAAITALGKSSEEISHSVDVIASIAEQTNLLALNAAIEAARAGEHGRGFAVVAEEVRKLAEESGEFSKKISQTMQSVQSDMERAIEAGRRGGEYVSNGLTSVQTADEVFQSISAAIQQLDAGVKGITDGIRQMDSETQTVREQIVSVQEVSMSNASGVQSVSGAAQEQSASMEEISAETRTLSNLADQLAGETKVFKL